MCTVSWVMEQQGYTVFFNRDELKTRSRGLLPSIRNRDGVEFIAPTDPDEKGTWIGVNVHGFACCLLNQYGRTTPTPAGTCSRGLVVESILASASQTEALRKLRDLQLGEWRPFLLLLFENTHVPLLCSWNGFEFVVSPATHSPISSSSFDTEAVIQTRKSCYPGYVSIDTLESFHASHIPERGPYSVCMHRPDAETVSFSKIRVSAKAVEFEYLPTSPCLSHEAPGLFLRISR